MKRHLKRISAPKTWDIKRKANKFIASPFPSGHKLEHTVSISTLLKEMIKTAKTTKDIKYILNNKEVLINGKKVKEHRRPVGLMDVVELKEINESYRIILSEKGKLKAISIKGDEAKIKLCKIVDKTKIKKNKMQLNMDDGRNIIVEKDDYKVGDTVVINITNLKIKESIKLEKGACAYLIGGKHIGQTGNIIDQKNNLFTIKGNEKKFVADKKHLIIVGKDKPQVTLK